MKPPAFLIPPGQLSQTFYYLMNFKDFSYLTGVLKKLFIPAPSQQHKIIPTKIFSSHFIMK